MTSRLIIVPVEKLKAKINLTIKSFQDLPGVYVSLNKTKKSTEDVLKKAGINTKKLFFIDCVTSEKSKDGVIHIAPTKLDLLSMAIREFIKDIKGTEFIMIDAFATLLIYNNENKVAKFIKEVTEFASKYDTNVIAFSPKTKGEELLTKIFNFFDKVEKT